eukprot:jgi/Chlat1/5308/Chrsp35S05198
MAACSVLAAWSAASAASTAASASSSSSSSFSCQLRRPAPPRGVFRSPELRARPQRLRFDRTCRASWRDYGDRELTVADSKEEDEEPVTFEYGVELFNSGEYYKCHDVLEELWHRSQEPQRNILHGILQCAVGLHHLSADNHRGAMLELGEGVRKLQRLRLDDEHTLYPFVEGVQGVLQFVYNTQASGGFLTHELEYAACTDDVCITMNSDEESYNLLGNFGRGQRLYAVGLAGEGVERVIRFSSKGFEDEVEAASSNGAVSVTVPLLQARAADLDMW